MARRNRVTPAGDLIREGRGGLMGNRGVIHDAGGEIVRPFREIRWISCLLEFKGRRRPIMTPGRWTELFFLDEATALAAGHRPCAECRRPDFNRFRQAWADGQGWDDVPSAVALDQHLHAERWDPSARAPRRWIASAAVLPDSTFVMADDEPHLVDGDGVRRWTPTGYDDPRPRPTGDVEILTPPSTVAALAAGYQPMPRDAGGRGPAPRR